MLGDDDKSAIVYKNNTIIAPGYRLILISNKESLMGIARSFRFFRVMKSIAIDFRWCSENYPCSANSLDLEIPVAISLADNSIEDDP